jgi:prepilin-type N-terminal cleavage/methylation domain-containing protein
VFSVTLIKNSQKGFTLFELMVAVILAGIMMTGAFLISKQFMDLWEAGKSRMEAQRQGTYALGVMERNIKQGNDYLIENYGSGTDNKITVKNIPTQIGQTIVAKDIVYYWDNSDTEHYQPIKEKKDTPEIIIIPETYTYIEGDAGKSDFEVEDLTFADENRLDAGGNIVARAVRIDLKLKNPDVEKPVDFTVSARLRNENVN